MHRKKAETTFKIPVSQPALIAREKEYVLDCLTSSWISSNGNYIRLFEENFARFIGVKYAITCCNGTSALHLALLAIGIKKQDEVICPVFTYVATANAIKYVGAKPVFIDCERETWNLNPRLLERLITPRTRAIIPVHIYGHPCKMDPVMKIARKYDLFVVEDAAEALGSRYKGRMCGSFGDVSTFSFYGNKTITTGEGGMVVTNDDVMAERLRILKGQGMDPHKRYWFPVVGYNYRMTNVQAAIGLAQLENAETFILRRQAIARAYDYYLERLPGITLPKVIGNVFHSFWMYSILIEKEFGRDRDEVIDLLQKGSVETRPFFYPMHMMPVYKKGARKLDLAISEDIASRGINLPTFFALREQDIQEICRRLVRLKVHKITVDREVFEVRMVTTEYRSQLSEFFNLLRSEGSEKFFHPHPLDNFTADKLARDSEMHKDIYYLVLNKSKKISAYFMLKGFDEGFEIPSFGIAVHPAFRRKGLGREIMKITLHICEMLRVKKVMLKVHKDNISGKKLYDSFGFIFSGRGNEQIGLKEMK